ncbi:MAG: DUF2905 domain-containing protein [Azoarcus sp.]|nr:DUF2905 domain-containing protein [Azoarcus sp.]|tara:strand:- start:78 stop:275 length:198 start_codon:yes stop_codon:yes gene_type:complete
MLKWLIVILVIVLVTGMFRATLSRHLRLGRLPGDVHFNFRGRAYHFPFTSTLLLSAVAMLLLWSI